MKERKIQLAELLKFRDLWMGFAMLWIVVYHFNFDLRISVLDFVENIGYGGVDIFLLASGLGCYYSLNKNSDTFKFLCRRFFRLMPTYWVFLVFWCAYMMYNGLLNVKGIIGNVFCLQSLTDSSMAFNWYITGIWILYLFAPFFKGLIDSFTTKSSYVLTICVLLIISSACWFNNDFIVIATRFPIFLIGMYLAKWSLNKEVYLSGFAQILLCCISVVGFGILYICKTRFEDLCWNYGLHWYPFLLITPGLCIVLYYLFSLISAKPIHTIFSCLGKNSFEIYLIHLFFIKVYQDLVSANTVEVTVVNNIIVVLLIVVGCILLKQIVKAIGKINKKA